MRHASKAPSASPAAQPKCILSVFIDSGIMFAATAHILRETDVTGEVVLVDQPPLCLRPSEELKGLGGELPWIFRV